MTPRWREEKRWWPADGEIEVKKRTKGNNMQRVL